MLASVLAQWDGKSTDALSAAYQANYNRPDFANDVLDTLGSDQQIAGSWLLKRHLEIGNELSADQRTRLYTQLHQLNHWQSRLHILQSLEFLKLDAHSLDQIEHFLRKALQANNKFERTWAYNGFHLLANQHENYRQEADQFLQMALQDEAPSVKARIRQIMKTKG